jgi:Raf kinase inhibitor-like YbhB/YbcL family protein
MALSITSSAFQNGAGIPKEYTCDGQNISPPLRWSGVPAGAGSLALIADDPDAPGGTWIHWVVYDLPATVVELSAHVPAQARLPNGGRQGKNDFRTTGYGGPCPPSGTHRYFFKLYALDKQLGLADGATKADVVKAMEGHVLAQGELMGTFRR